MAKKRYQSIIEMLTSRGIVVEKSKTSLFGAYLSCSYPIGEKKMMLALSYSSVFRSVNVDIHIPYSPFKGPLMDLYDSLFPEEKSMWGRSTPKFTQAIVDYMRGQVGGLNKVELLQGETDLHLVLGTPTSFGGEGGFKQGIEKISFELRRGPMHEQVLTHMFAF